MNLVDKVVCAGRELSIEKPFRFSTNISMSGTRGCAQTPPVRFGTVS